MANDLMDLLELFVGKVLEDVALRVTEDLEADLEVVILQRTRVLIPYCELGLGVDLVPGDQ